MSFRGKLKFIDYTCAECSFLRWSFSFPEREYHCRKTYRAIYDKWNIPDWCPKFTWWQKLIRNLFWFFTHLVRVLWEAFRRKNK